MALSRGSTVIPDPLALHHQVSSVPFISFLPLPSPRIRKLPAILFQTARHIIFLVPRLLLFFLCCLGNASTSKQFTAKHDISWWSRHCLWAVEKSPCLYGHYCAVICSILALIAEGKFFTIKDHPAHCLAVYSWTKVVLTTCVLSQDVLTGRGWHTY